MTPAEFRQAYQPYANSVAAGTGLRAVVLLAQWAVETKFGAAINNQNNLGNIRCLAEIPCVEGFSQFPSLDSFTANAIATWQNGDYGAVLATAGQSQTAQALAIGASPWDAGHYVGLPPFDYQGGSIIQALQEIQLGTVADLDQSWLTDTTERLAAFLGTLPPADRTVPVTAAALLGAVKAIQNAPPATVDLTPVLTAISNVSTEVANVAASVAAVKADVDAIKAKTDKDLA